VPATRPDEQAARFAAEAASRVDDACAGFDRDWLGTPAGLGGVAGALRARSFDDVVAFANPAAPEVDFMNRIAGLRTRHAPLVPEIAAWYRAEGAPFWAEIRPEEGFRELADALAREGARQVDFHSFLYGPVTPLPPAPTALGVTVEPVGRAEFDLFLETLLGGIGVSGADRRLHAHWPDLDHWRLYLARVDGTPAGAAVLRVSDGVGLLANASTLPAFRGRGAQAALVARRTADAAAEGCELMASCAVFGSASHRNLERAGLRVAFTKAVWRTGA
jgi:hypothetical protein